MRRLLLEKESSNRLLSEIIESQRNGSLTSGAIFILRFYMKRFIDIKYVFSDEDNKKEMFSLSMKEIEKKLDTFDEDWTGLVKCKYNKEKGCLAYFVHVGAHILTYNEEWMKYRKV